MFCTNCEVHYERSDQLDRGHTVLDRGHTGSAIRDGDYTTKYFCPRCEYRLYEKHHDATPLPAHHKLTK